MKLKKHDGTVTSITKPERSVTIKVRRFLNPEFAEAIRKLGKMPLTPNFSMKAKRATLAIYNASKDYVTKRHAAFEEFCDRDALGGAQFVDEAKTEYKVTVKEKECLAALEALVEVELSLPVIYLSAFRGVDVTPEFLLALDEIVVEDHDGKYN